MDFQKNNLAQKWNFSDNQNFYKKLAFYNNDFEEDVYPENKFNNKDRIAIYKRNKNYQKDFKDVLIGDDLDVPLKELEDQQENIGSDEEENNYYSFGYDNEK